MKIQLYSTFDEFKNSGQSGSFGTFVEAHPNGNFFQSPVFFEFISDIEGYAPMLITTTSDAGQITGSLLGVIQTSGSGLKSWFSRRLIVWGGPLVAPMPSAEAREVTEHLLAELVKYANGRSIYVEFRNFFDTSESKETFEACGFEYKAHLNYFVKTDEEAAVRKRTSSSRIRQIKSSVKEGAEIGEAASAADVAAFYAILEKLYREKVKKPLPTQDLFMKFWKSGIGKFFIIRQQDRIIGGIVCPVFAGKVIYEWYICGEDGLAQGLHPSVMATWAPIEYGFKNGFDHFDFMGAGKPDQDYGVREFKARFGGDEVNFGRYEMVVSKPLYKVGKIGLKVYQSIK
ncbi:MAG: peptidoglycan bridge formation glycyltransferase FemA/FemB family protein [Saprospiraceae bacterium]|nr:peptidoglycan bridge formation glycyltransferase FemA/FemB family protein [Saprospiraceae bacterium]